MLEIVKITEISILDKHIIADAVNSYGAHCKTKYVNDTSNRGWLMQHSVAQHCFHALTQLFNTEKVLRMDKTDRVITTRSQKFKIHSAIVAVLALQHYQKETTDVYIHSRADVLWNKIESQLI